MSEHIIEVEYDTFNGTYTQKRHEEIVRCRDCKRFSLDNSDHDYRSGWWCHRWDTDMVKPDGFCAWASRKGERMSITDELRKEARGFGRYVYTAPQADCLTAIADRIDAEHEAACAEAYGNGVMSVPIALDESAWVKLPVDADGVPIHIGDVMEWCDSGETLTVEGIGRDVLFYIDGENAEWTAARNKRHHHTPTVEDVLREFAYGLGVPVADSYIAASAAKLRLAGDGE